MKFVREQSKPISADTGLEDIERIVIDRSFVPGQGQGAVQRADMRNRYIDHLLDYVDLQRMRNLTVVMNCGNGCAGPILEELEPKLPLNVVTIFPEPDGSSAEQRIKPGHGEGAFVVVRARKA